MTTAMAFAVLDTLPRIGVAELECRAALQTRVDRKYVMTAGEAGRRAAPWQRVLRRHFTAVREELVHG